MTDEPPIDSLGVNAWATDGGVMIAFLRPNGYWRWVEVSHADAVQLADQLYLLTKAEP